MPCFCATFSAPARVREAIATGLNPALRYATRWQSLTMNPAPRMPMRKFVRCGTGELMLRSTDSAFCFLRKNKSPPVKGRLTAWHAMLSILVTFPHCLIRLRRQTEQEIEKRITLADKKSAIGEEVSRSGRPSQWNGGWTND